MVIEVYLSLKHAVFVLQTYFRFHSVLRFILQLGMLGQLFVALPLFKLIVFTAKRREIKMLRKMEMREKEIGRKMEMAREMEMGGEIEMEKGGDEQGGGIHGGALRAGHGTISG
jgi:hypothetical protein